MALAQDLTYPAYKTAAVTPSDTDHLGDVKALYIGGSGDVAIRAMGDSAAVTHSNVTAGTVLWVRAGYVYSTGTTATNIVAWY